MMKRILILSVILFLQYNQIAVAGKGEINFVETQVDLKSDGKAVVANTVQYKVLSGDLHRFIFQRNDQLRVRIVSRDSYAIDSDGNRYGLSIDKVRGDTWQIALAGGKGVSSGTVTFIFYFSTDFAEAGCLVPTVSPDGKQLTVFNWSPVQWDEAHRQDHYTLKVLTCGRLWKRANVTVWNSGSIILQRI